MSYEELQSYRVKYNLTHSEYIRLVNMCSYYPVTFDENAVLDEIRDILWERELKILSPNQVLNFLL